MRVGGLVVQLVAVTLVDELVAISTSSWCSSWPRPGRRRRPRRFSYRQRRGGRGADGVTAITAALPVAETREPVAAAVVAVSLEAAPARVGGGES